MLGKIGIFLGKSFKKSFFQEIPRNFPRKKMYEKSTPDELTKKNSPKCSPIHFFAKINFGKEQPKILGYFCNFQKTEQSKQSPNE
jgi:hypothetical protein